MTATVADLMIADLSISKFRGAIRGAVRGLWSGIYDRGEFFGQMLIALDVGFEEAWREGAREVGIRPDERTQEEQEALFEALDRNIQYINGFADAIIAGSKANKGKLRTQFQRAELWINRYSEVRNLAVSMAEADQKLEWVLGPTEEHCIDCSKYSGRVYRASIWKKYNIQPQSHLLSCKGFRCLCSFQPTTAKANKGRPPSPSGG